MAKASEEYQTLFDQEEQDLQEAQSFLGDARALVSRFESGESIPADTLAAYLAKAVGRVDTLARGYRASIRHQRQLMRHSDRNQEALRQAKDELADKSARLEDLNDQLKGEIEQRKSLEQQLLDLPPLDSLTGLAARRHFMERAGQALAQSQRYGAPLAAIVLDIDHFKHVNDVYGHAVGDDVLIGVAQRLRGQLRGADVVGRLGGEEFACILPETNAAGAAQVCERVRQGIADSPVAVEAAAIGEIAITVSLGCSVYDGAGDGLEELLQRADQALYAAKEQGRNCAQAA